MENFLILTFVVLILGSAILYIRKEKKKGVKCIGCPDAAACSGNCSGCPGRCKACSSNDT